MSPGPGWGSEPGTGRALGNFRLHDRVADLGEGKGGVGVRGRVWGQQSAGTAEMLGGRHLLGRPFRKVSNSRSRGLKAHLTSCGTIVKKKGVR